MKAIITVSLPREELRLVSGILHTKLESSIRACELAGIDKDSLPRLNYLYSAIFTIDKSLDLN